MKALIFDASSIITLSMNGLLQTFRGLKKEYKGRFMIPKAVKLEVIDHPLNTKRFKFEALKVLDTVKDGYLEIYHSARVDRLMKELMALVNHIYQARGKDVQILHDGEMAALALCLFLNADAYVVDERTMRMIIEEPENLADLLSNKLHTHVSIDHVKLEKFRKIVGNVKIIRSTELMAVAFEKGLLDKYASREGRKIVHVDLKKNLLDGILWGLKLRGCSISVDEINKLMKLEGL